MRLIRPNAPLALVATLATALQGCQQSDQKLPFELDPTGGQTVSVMVSGGTVSVPPGFSIRFPEGSLPSTEIVTAQKRLTSFPSVAGVVLPGTAYDVGPAGTALSPGAPARVQIAVPSTLLGAGDDLGLVVGLLESGGDVLTDVTSYDIANGILTADIFEIGPVAAVISNDLIPLGDIANVPTLDGGAIAQVGAPLAAPPAGAPTYPGGVEFMADCAPGDRSCFTSGIAKIWVDDVVRSRLGDELVLLNTTVDARVEFFSFNPLSSLPDSVVGYLRVDGDLRARINEVVASRRLGDEIMIFTGNGVDPDNPEPTAISFTGGTMSMEFTSEGDPEMLEFDVSGVGTSDLLTIQLEGTLDFENASGPPTQGTIIAHVRLRR